MVFRFGGIGMLCLTVLMEPQCWGTHDKGLLQTQGSFCPRSNRTKLSILSAASLCCLPFPFSVSCGPCSGSEHTVNKQLWNRFGPHPRGAYRWAVFLEQGWNYSIRCHPPALMWTHRWMILMKCWWWRRNYSWLPRSIQNIFSRL